jgi:hypothetical protein
MTDEKAGHGRRFGLVEMSSPAEAQAAISRLDLRQFDDTVISVSFWRADQQAKIDEEGAYGQVESTDASETAKGASEKREAASEGRTSRGTEGCSRFWCS